MNEEYKKDFADYQNSGGRIQKLAASWQQERTETQFRRDLRNFKVDVETEKLDGLIKYDELITPLRLIDTNIRREQAAYITYLKQSRRQVTFKDVENPSIPLEPLETDFTTKCRYEGWELPLFSLVDGFQTHGWDSMEVEYDLAFPGGFSFNHIAHEDLLFPFDSEDIQKLEFIMIARRYTQVDLVGMVENYKFNEAQMIKVLNPSDDKREESLFKIYKVLFKKKGIVYVGWACPEKCDDWLRSPQELFLGKRTPKISPVTGEPIVNLSGEIVEWEDVKETDYPVVLFPYLISENKKITSAEGRAWLDEHVQQAVTSLLSSFVTGHRRATNPYISAEDIAGDGTIEQTNIKTVPGFIVKGKVNFNFMQHPSSDMLTAIQSLITQNQSEQSRVDFAAMNRQDSRKTATEVSAALTESNILSSIQVALFSIGLRRLYTYAWNIYKSCVQQRQITTSVPLEMFTRVYILEPAGNQDVIERQERLVKMQQSWPVIQGTGNPLLIQQFLKDMITLMFPERAPTYLALIDTGNAYEKQIEGLKEIIKALSIDPSTGTFTEQAAPYEGILSPMLNQPTPQQNAA